MKDLDKPTVGPVHLQLFRPSVIRGPCIDPQLYIPAKDFLNNMQKFRKNCDIQISETSKKYFGPIMEQYTAHASLRAISAQ